MVTMKIVNEVLLLQYNLVVSQVSLAYSVSLAGHAYSIKMRNKYSVGKSLHCSSRSELDLEKNLHGKRSYYLPIFE